MAASCAATIPRPTAGIRATWQAIAQRAACLRRGVAPFFIDAQKEPGAAVQQPVGGLTVIQFRNHHLGYALTWFALAALVVVAAWIVLREERRRGGAH